MLSGLSPDTSTGLIKATGFSSLPDWFSVDPNWLSDKSNKKASDKWYQLLASRLNGAPGNQEPNQTPKVTVDYLWKNRNLAIPSSKPGFSWPLAVISSLSEIIGEKKAEALGGWLCGGYQYDGLFGLSKTAFDSDDFLDAKNCYGYFDPTVRISDCLLELKKNSVPAFDWVIRAANAKAANKVAHELTMYNKTIQAEKKIVADVVNKAADVVKSAGEGVGGTADVAGFLLKNIWWVGPIGLLGFFYVKAKMEKSIIESVVGSK
jgi:hypothetical protein